MTAKIVGNSGEIYMSTEKLRDFSDETAETTDPLTA